MAKSKKFEAKDNSVINDASGGGTIIMYPPIHTKSVQLLPNRESVRTFNIDDLKQIRFQALMKGGAALLIGIAAIWADSIQITSHYKLSPLWALPFACFAAMYIVKPHLKSMNILNQLPDRLDKSSYVGDNTVCKRLNDVKVQTYELEADCIYPNCKGRIFLTDAPPRERERLMRSYVGICSHGAKDHSYRLDAIWNAYREQFDWRPIENENKEK
jgi:hypothetical protein